MDLKEFLAKHQWFVEDDREGNYEGQYPLSVTVNELGLFFWERGGKQYFLRMLKGKWTPDEIINYFNEDERYILTGHNNSFMAENYNCERQNARDCLACLGEEKVKELIKDLEKGAKYE